MKKTVIIASVTGIILVLSTIGGNFIASAYELPWSRGIKNEEIKALQGILKKDATIYPEGYVTGYFGPLTEKAIKRLQKKFGLPETGTVDESTNQLIFPYLKVNVISPNGDEVWDRSEIQTIRWAIATLSGGEIQRKEAYFRPKASIDLFREVEIAPGCMSNESCPPIVGKKVFVKHIVTVGLFDGAYSWKIPENIKNGKDYIIRITVGRNIIPFLLKEEMIQPEEIWEEVPRRPFVYWDESDGPFEITGVTQPKPLPLGEIIEILEKIMNELQKAIALLKEMNH